MKTIIKILAVIALMFLVFDQSRSIYKLDDNLYITVWKRWGGKCIITLDKHYSIFKPSQYIETTNDSYLTIVVEKSSKFDCAIYSGYNKPVRWFGYKRGIDFYKTDMFDDFEKKYYKNDGLKENTLYFSIDIKEKYVSRFGEIK